MLELNYKNWLKWQKWRDDNFLVNEAAENKYDRFHKMCACQKMTAKRFKKLLMAVGFSRNEAEKLTKETDVYWYRWMNSVYNLVPKIKARTDKNAAYRLIRAIFGETEANKYMKGKSKIQLATDDAFLFGEEKYEESEKKKKAEFENFVSLKEKYKYFASQDDFAKYDAKKVKGIIESNENVGEKLLAYQMGERHDMNLVSNWLSFCNWYERRAKKS